MKVYRMAAVTFLFCAIAVPLSAQSVSLRDDLLKDWGELKSTMMNIAAAMPEEKYSFKPTPPQRNFGEQVLHDATVNVMYFRTITTQLPVPTIDAKATRKADVLQALSDSFDYGTAVIRVQTDQTLNEVVERAAFLGRSTRARVIWNQIGHTWDMYGQMAVYLRLNGIVPPASQRP